MAVGGLLNGGLSNCGLLNTSPLNGGLVNGGLMDGGTGILDLGLLNGGRHRPKDGSVSQLQIRFRRRARAENFEAGLIITLPGI